MSVKNPHDNFFKKVFSNIDNVKDLFRNMLPEEISSNIDYNSLKLSDKSFVEEIFKERHSDLLIEANYRGNRIFVYLLLEHKSYEDKMSMLQMLKYMTSIWERENKDKLTPILPILFYHGKKEWRFGNSFSMYFDDLGNVLEKYTPVFHTVLIDLNKKKQ